MTSELGRRRLAHPPDRGAVAPARPRPETGLAGDAGDGVREIEPDDGPPLFLLDTRRGDDDAATRKLRDLDALHLDRLLGLGVPAEPLEQDFAPEVPPASAPHDDAQD